MRRCLASASGEQLILLVVVNLHFLVTLLASLRAFLQVERSAGGAKREWTSRYRALRIENLHLYRGKFSFKHLPTKVRVIQINLT